MQTAIYATLLLWSTTFGLIRSMALDKHMLISNRGTHQSSRIIYFPYVALNVHLIVEIKNGEKLFLAKCYYDKFNSPGLPVPMR